MNILLISDLYPLNIPLHYENKDNYYLHDLATELQNIGHIVDVVKLNSIWKFFYDRQNFYSNGVYELDKNIIYNINYFIPYFSTPQEKLNDDIDINNYDIVIAHGLNGIFFCEKLIKGKIKPFVSCLHPKDIAIINNIIVGKLLKKKLKNILRKSTLIGARTPSAIKNIKLLFPNCNNKLFLTSNGIDRDLILSQPLILEKFIKWKTNKHLNILTINHSDDKCNLDLIIKSIEKIDLFNWDLNIIDYANSDIKYQKIIEELNLNHKIKFFKETTPEQQKELLKQADLFILLKKHIDFGTIYLEALALGCITICLKNQGIDGILIHNYNGYVVNNDEKDLVKLFNRICKISSDKLNSLSNNIYKTVIKHTKENSILNYSNSLYKKIPLLNQINKNIEHNQKNKYNQSNHQELLISTNYKK